MFKSKKIVLLPFALIITVAALAQRAAGDPVSEQTGLMRSEAKIYVVMVVVITILAGLLFYLARLDRKISKLEKGGHV